MFVSDGSALNSAADPRNNALVESAVPRYWLEFRQRLRIELGEDVFASWFQRMEFVRHEEGIVTLSVPTRFLRNWLHEHYLERMSLLLRKLDVSISTLEMIVRTSCNVETSETQSLNNQNQQQNLKKASSLGAPFGSSGGATYPHAAQALEKNNASFQAPSLKANAQGKEFHGKEFYARTDGAKEHATKDLLEGSPLDRRLTFANFHTSRSNQIAYAAAQQIIMARLEDAPIYNPLYIHANVGLGKTHLLQATAFAVENSGRKVLYLTAEKFMYSFISALKAQTALAFKDSLRAIDVLVIDDVQFLNGKTNQSEFCHTINNLLDAGKQVIIAADRLPLDLENFDERSQSRLAGGLVVEISGLDEALRQKIIASRVEAARQHMPDLVVSPEVMAHVASLIISNGRDLEGAVNRLIARVTMSGETLTIDSAEQAIRDLIRNREVKKVKIEDIQRLVASHYNVSRQDLLSSRRTASVVHPRQIAMYLSKTLTPRSLPEIGKRFGGRDHTTVLHAVRKIEKLLTVGGSISEELDHLRRMLQE